MNQLNSNSPHAGANDHLTLMGYMAEVSLTEALLGRLAPMIKIIGKLFSQFHAVVLDDWTRVYLTKFSI